MELRGNWHAVLQQLHGAFAVVSPAAAAPFQRKNIQTGGVGAFPVKRAVSPAAAGPDGECIRVGRAQARAEVQMLQKAVPDAEQIGAFFILQMKYAVFDSDHSTR